MESNWLYSFSFSYRDSVAARDLMWLSSGVFQYSLFLYTKRDYTTLRIGSLFDNPGFETINEGFGIKEYMLGGNRVCLCSP